MENIDYFKLQAKNLLKDYKTQLKEESGGYKYNPRFFNIEEIVKIFEIDEVDEFTLMNAQHIIAKIAGFEKWAELINASDSLLKAVRSRDELASGRKRLVTKQILFDMDNHPQFSDDPIEEHYQIMQFANDAAKREEEYAKKFLGDDYLDAKRNGKLKYKDFGIPNCVCNARTALLFRFYTAKTLDKSLLVLNCLSCSKIHYVYQELE